MSDIVERLRSQSILDVWHPMMLEAADEIERQRKVISATIEDIQYLKDKQIEAAAEIEKLRAALKETLEIASRNEAGDYQQRAAAALKGLDDE